MKYIIFLFFIILCFSTSCIKFIEVERIKTDTLIVKDTVKLIVKDTIVLIKNDTLIIRDTLKITKIDTLVIRDTIRYSQNEFQALNIVADGNSLTYGYTYPNVFSESYVSKLMKELPFRENGSNAYNLSVGGQTITDMLLDATSEVDSKINKYKKNICLIWEGRNEIVVNETSSIDCFNKLKKYCEDRKKAGFEVYLFTVTPSYSNYDIDTDVNNRIKQVNQLIINDKSNTFKVVRLDLIPELNITQYTVNQYYTDSIHLTDLGYYLVMQKVKETILK